MAYNLNYGKIQDLGFRGTDAFEPTKNSIGLFWRRIALPNGRARIIFIDTLKPRLGWFDLDAAEAAAFKANTLSLVPPGYCAPTAKSSGRAVRERCTVFHEGPVRSGAHLKKLLAGMEPIV